MIVRSKYWLSGISKQSGLKQKLIESTLIRDTFLIFFGTLNARNKSTSNLYYPFELNSLQPGEIGRTAINAMKSLPNVNMGIAEFKQIEMEEYASNSLNGKQ